ncbi:MULTISPECIES: GTP 3',8-cyclase MoaA [Thiomicrorhabdus]|uniref:GTP 3',8-cyclase n=1 Tax=Thiomicrorhabdus heinhorstiae TaxID=2748010 RepID=A0ABS0BZ66_9GAMM|nr:MULTISPECIES: GTP 3',8-cyclase MoaA [Thiomicrorhabdus]MBF6059088.1 GTP 3',8-cyclase MoaA [Thiomicrorhabdus heinhorstiae]
MSKSLIDPFERRIEYVRVSVTDLCNYRCGYCMPEQGVHPEGHHAEYLSYEELARIIKAFVDLGVSKVRLTGGEPLVRKRLYELVEMIKPLEGLEDIALSTNAHHLEREAEKLHLAGVDRCNISIDSLRPQRFNKITRGGDLEKVLKGVDKALEVGMKPVKFNMVVMKGTNDDEIEAMVDYGIEKGVEVRFIETMPIGPAGVSMMDQHYAADKILKRVKAHVGADLIPSTDRSDAGPARNFHIAGTNARIGVISAVSQHFCESCNRVRLTARGVLALCLGQEDSVDLRTPLREGISDQELQQLIINAIAKKPERHFFNENVHNIEFRQMVQLGG